MTQTYICSAVVRDMLCTDEVQAVSTKQAWYLFSKKNGFKHRDFKILDTKPVSQVNEQLSFNI